ncbi:MAG: hypothetical protein ACTIM4_15245 [Marinomonas sp.]|uniref:hypothetical protein n=1 Tax=Marinomonas sp. TaxID=1904862 RepID=UPI003F97C098
MTAKISLTTATRCNKPSSTWVLGSVTFEGETVFTKALVVALYYITDRTIGRYLSSHADELKSNGYQVLEGKKTKVIQGANVWYRHQ